VRQSTARRVARFLGSQAVKSFYQPSRLLFAPLFILVLLLPRFPGFLPRVLSVLPTRWLEKGAGREVCFDYGHKLFQLDRPVEAWPWLQRILQSGRPSTRDYLVGALCLYHGMGRFRDAVSLLARANEHNRKEATRLGLENLPFRVLDGVWARHIGHTATIDYVIKLGILEGRKRDDTLFYVPPANPVANRFLLQQVATKLRLVEGASDLPFDPSAVQALHYDYLGPGLPDRTTAYFREVAGKTYARWQREGRGPLFALPADTKARGWEALQSAGIPKGAWFVALHVREGKWDGRNAGVHGVLNADIGTYALAIAEITSRGGWVIRMGDPGMTPLPPRPNVLDYCHSEIRADWMDVFIAACCRFMVGTSSGPAYVPPMYGVPVVLSNWFPPAQRAWHASDIFVPKLLRRSANGRYLTLSETLREPFSWCHSVAYLSQHEGLHIEDNDPELIRAAVEEMLARLAGDANYGADTTDLQARAERIYAANDCFGMGRLAAGFLRHHGDLIA
jgi:putative glycosyltransferase (TIGR04372 family)